MMSDIVTIQPDGPVITLTLNQPERRNTLTPDMLTALRSAVTAIRQRHGLRAVILQASGSYFSAGSDVQAFTSQPDRAAYADRFLTLLHATMLDLIELPMPLITAVQGPANGSAIGLALIADIVLVAPEASFTAYATTLGLGPEGGWTALLPRLIGQRRAAEALLLERTLSAEEAIAWGLANRLVPASHLRDEARAIAHQIAAQLPGSVAGARRLLWADHASTVAALERERAFFCAQIQLIEAEIGMRAFLERQRTDPTREVV